ncbi:hypothetical protein AGLY_012724, partial [Aphis glycines]
LRDTCLTEEFVLNPNMFVIDFEIGIYEVVRSIWPTKWFRKLQNLSLSKVYIERDTDDGKFFNYIFSLSLLEPDDVEDFTILRLLNRKLYARHIPPYFWASKPEVKTNNVCESFHSKFNAYFYHHHPSLYKFIDALQDTTNKIRWTNLKKCIFEKNTVNSVITLSSKIYIIIFVFNFNCVILNSDPNTLCKEKQNISSKTFNRMETDVHNLPVSLSQIINVGLDRIMVVSIETLIFQYSSLLVNLHMFVYKDHYVSLLLKPVKPAAICLRRYEPEELRSQFYYYGLNVMTVDRKSNRIHHIIYTYGDFMCFSLPFCHPVKFNRKPFTYSHSAMCCIPAARSVYRRTLFRITIRSQHDDNNIITTRQVAAIHSSASTRKATKTSVLFDLRFANGYSATDR